MKLAKLAGICKKNKTIQLYHTDSGEQWLGDTGAIYLILHLPKLDREAIFAMWDILGKAPNSFYFRSGDIPEGICVKDVVEGENKLEGFHMDFALEDRSLRSLLTQQGIVFIDTRYLEPLEDLWEDLELYERMTPEGEVYIAAKTGFMLRAVIMPYNALNNGMVEKLERIAALCRVAWDNKVARG